MRQSLEPEPAKPRKTRIARLSRTTSASSRRPKRVPILVLGTVVILSTINRHGARRPFPSVGTIGSRKSGASVGSVVNAQIVIEAVASKRSSCKITVGRGAKNRHHFCCYVVDAPETTRTSDLWFRRPTLYPI